MENLKFDHHPREYYSGADFCNEKQKDEQKLLSAYTEEDVRIEVNSNSGAKTSTVYKATLKNKNQKPSSIDDFEFEVIDI